MQGLSVTADHYDTAVAILKERLGLITNKVKSTNTSQETIVKTKNAATTMATFHTRKNNFKIFKLQKGQ